MDAFDLPNEGSRTSWIFWVTHAVTFGEIVEVIKINVPIGGHSPVPLLLSPYFTLPLPTLSLPHPSTSSFASEEKGKKFNCKEGGRGPLCKHSIRRK